jgi:IclR family acetate operon transcriptional repressor
MRIEPENRYMIFPQAGSVIPFHTTCIGKILLAHMEPAKRDSILSGYPYDRLTANTITTRERLMEELDQVRKTGTGFDNQESIKGLAGVGGPIFNHSGVVIAAFAITGNAENIAGRRESIIDAVKFTSQQVSAQLGYAG